MTDLVQEYIEKYHKFSHYRDLARRVEDICQQQLKKSSIEYISSSRSKSRDSLRKKLEKRNAELIIERKKGYQKVEEIREDVYDSAGVRIALYFPNQTDDVKRMISNTFKGPDGSLGKPKFVKHPPEPSKPKAPTDTTTLMNAPNMVANTPFAASFQSYEGYQALHAWIFLQESQSTGLDDWRHDDIIEIQIVSVLIHNWAQVTHDMIYKNLYEEASSDEVLIVRNIRAMLGVAEVQLNQLHQKFLERTKNPFCDVYELARYLGKRVDPSNIVGDPEDRRTGMLLHFLQITQKNTPETLNPILAELGLSKAPNVDENASRERWRRVEEQYLPFVPSSRPSFCVIAYILSKVPKASQDLQEYSSRDRCRILLSAILWLKRLSSQSYDGWRAWDKATKEQEPFAFGWPFTGFKRCEICAGEEPDSSDLNTMQTLWRWFEKQVNEGPSIFSFVFLISVMGIRKEFLPESEEIQELDRWKISDDEDDE